MYTFGTHAPTVDNQAHRGKTMNKSETVTVNFNGNEYTTPYKIVFDMISIDYLGHKRTTQLGRASVNLLVEGLFIEMLQREYTN